MPATVSTTPRTALLVTLVVLIIIADQLSKAWFVFHLGKVATTDFGEFARQYFALWAGWQTHQIGQVSTHYSVEPGLSVFKPPEAVWPRWIYWHLVTNTGAAWSMFAGNSLALSGVSAVMAALLSWVWARHFRYHTAMTWALGGIIGGALGNFIDRFRLHEVVDFIDVKLPLIGRLFPQLGDPYDFPIFNVADSCAVCGTLALALYLIVSDLQHIAARRKAAAASLRSQPAPDYYDPFQLSAEEKAAKIAALEDMAESVRAGEQFTPRSHTGEPLGLHDGERDSIHVDSPADEPSGSG